MFEIRFKVEVSVSGDSEFKGEEELPIGEYEEFEVIGYLPFEPHAGLNIETEVSEDGWARVGVKQSTWIVGRGGSGYFRLEVEARYWGCEMRSKYFQSALRAIGWICEHANK